MALNTSKCNHLTPLPFKGLSWLTELTSAAAAEAFGLHAASASPAGDGCCQLSQPREDRAECWQRQPAIIVSNCSQNWRFAPRPHCNNQQLDAVSKAAHLATFGHVRGTSVSLNLKTSSAGACVLCSPRRLNINPPVLTTVWLTTISSYNDQQAK